MFDNCGLTFTFQVVSTPCKCPEQHCGTDQTHSRGKDKLSEGLTSHISAQLGSFKSQESLKQMESTIDQIALWFLGILPFLTQVVVLWPLPKFYYGSQVLGHCNIHPNVFYPLSLKKNIYQSVFLEMLVLRDVHSHQWNTGKGESNVQINLANAYLGKDKQVPLLRESGIY